MTLNNQQYTDDDLLYHYYHPPYVFDIEPREGPVSGKTEVVVVGANFNDTGTIRCRFGDLESEAEFISSHKIKCVAPASPTPGYVDFNVALEENLYSSSRARYLFYETPVVHAIYPVCGPERGYT